MSKSALTDGSSMKTSYARIALCTSELSASIALALLSVTPAKLATFLPLKTILRVALLPQQRSGAEPAKISGESTALSALNKHALRLLKIQLSLIQSQVRSLNAIRFLTVLTMPVILTGALSVKMVSSSMKPESVLHVVKLFQTVPHAALQTLVQLAATRHL